MPSNFSENMFRREESINVHREDSILKRASINDMTDLDVSKSNSLKGEISYIMKLLLEIK